MTTPSILSQSTCNVTQIKRYDFEQHIKNKTCIIDVREEKELQETGVIPNSVNIPLGNIVQEFQLPSEVFERKYNCTKPGPNDTLVFTCRSGKRSNMACEQLVKLGYKNDCHGSEGPCQLSASQNGCMMTIKNISSILQLI